MRPSGNRSLSARVAQLVVRAVVERPSGRNARLANVPATRTRRVRAGRQNGTARPSSDSTAYASTDIPMRTFSIAQSVTLPIMRTPSSSSIIATAYGTSFLNGGWPFCRTIVKVCTTPRPTPWPRPRRRHKRCRVRAGRTGDGCMRGSFGRAVRRARRPRRRRDPGCRARAAVSPRCGRESPPSPSPPPQHDGADARKPAARTHRERQLGVGNLRVAGLAAQLPHRLGDQEEAAHARSGTPRARPRPC